MRLLIKTSALLQSCVLELAFTFVRQCLSFVMSHVSVIVVVVLGVSSLPILQLGRVQLAANGRIRVPHRNILETFFYPGCLLCLGSHGV